MSCVWTAKTSNLSSTYLACVQFSLTCSKFSSPDDSPKFRHAKICNTRAFASRKSVKKFRRQRETQKDLTPQLTSSTLNENDEMVDRSPLGVDNVEDSNKESSYVDLDAHKSNTIPSRTAVLQACTVTSGLIAVSGVLIRQVSHVASMEGWPILDCSTEVSYSFEMWHLQLVTGLVILISSCRYLLLKTWPDFAESSDAANQQELLFRGALLPLFGINLESVLLVSALFGVLHLGSGRKYSFAIWATFVGFVYGYATILSSSLVVPMASHAVSNLVGGLLWRYTSKLSR